MPTYEWYCPKCHNTTEVFRKMDDYLNPPDECDGCGQYYYRPESLVISRPKNAKGFILLGETGWHSKEYTRNGPIR